MNTKRLAAQILANVISRVGPRAWLGLGDADRALVEACCLDAADLEVSLLLAGDDPATANMLRREKAHVAAQLANLSAAGGMAVEAALWESASRLLVRAGAALLHP